MDERIKLFVGWDAHKDITSVAAYERGAELPRFVGTLALEVQVLPKVSAKAGDPAHGVVGMPGHVRRRPGGGR